MTKTTQIALTALVAGMAALSVNAAPIVGSISFSGNVTAYDSTDGSGSPSQNYTTTHSLVFGANQVAVGINGHNGSFAAPAVADNDGVTMYSPLEINPPALPIPATAALWSVDGFQFVLSTLTQTPDPASANFFELSGTGLITGNGFDATLGSWVATFTSANANGVATFSWNSSSAAESQAPDAGSGLLLLGLGLSALVAYSQFRKQVA